MAKGLLADPWKGENERAAQWVGLSDWQYESDLVVDAATLARDRVDVVFDGLDTFATVKINGAPALTADNMFRTWRIDAKKMLHVGRNTIEVDLQSPITKLQPSVLAMKHPLPGSYDSAFGDEPKGKQTANYVRKANYQYGWDWAPRLVTLGIWRPVRLEAYDGVRLDDAHVAQTHLDDQVAVLEAQAEIWSDRPRTLDVEVAITDPDGAPRRLTRRATLVAGVNRVAIPVRIDHPKRWWPIGYGAPSLYTVETTLRQAGVVLGRERHSIGLRTTELRRTKDAWGRRMALTINGVEIFAKGANLVPPDSFPARAPDERLDTVLKAAAAANMNMLRVWGGGYYLNDHAYETADRLGLMLWQEFAFGGALPPNDPGFRENTRVEAVEQVRRLRDHPSIVIWCGNNEVQTSWEHWDDRKAFQATLTPEARDRVLTGIVRLFDNVLRGVVAENAAGTPYWAGSPTNDYDGAAEDMTDGDVHFWKVWIGAPIEDYLTATPRFMSEFGLQSMPSLSTIESFLSPRRIADIPVALKDSGYDSGRGNGRLLDYIRASYGEPRTFGDYVYLSQLLQAEGLEMAVGHLRASRPQAMGAFYWTLNDAWPGQINSLWAGPAWGSLDFYNHWKALHYRARRFYAPVSVVAQRSEGVTKVSLVSDRTQPLDARWRLRVVDRDGGLISERQGAAVVAPLSALAVLTAPDADLLHGADPARTFAVAEMTVRGEVVARNFVYFTKAKTLALTDPGLRADLQPATGGYRLTIAARTLARGIWVDFTGVDAALSDNAFDLAPGESATITVTSGASLEGLRKALVVRSLFGAAR